MSKDITILYVIGDLDIGGAERHLVAITPLIKAAGFNPVVYTLTHRGSQAHVLTEAGIVVLEPPFGSRTRSLPGFVRKVCVLPISGLALFWHLIRIRPNILHCFLPAAYIVGVTCGLLARCRVRIMSRRSLNNYQSRHALAAKLERLFHKTLSAAIGNSRAVTAQLLSEGVKNELIGLIYNGVDVEKFHSRDRRPEIRRRLGLDSNIYLLVTVANLIGYKGHSDLLDALYYCKARLPKSWGLVCIGNDRGNQTSLAAHAEKLGLSGHVRWMGGRQDVRDWLCAADIGVLCSHEEGFANSILEYMAAGLPCIVTDVGGNREAVEHGVTGQVVPKKDIHAIGEAIVKMATHPERGREMGVAARVRVMEHFSLNACVSDYIRLYDGLLLDGSRPVSEILSARP